MKLEKNVLEGFGEQININNTLTGGIASTKVDLSQNEEGYIAHFYTPTVSGEAFKMILDGNALLVYALLKVPEEGTEKTIPKFVQAFPVPHYIDTERITASSKNGILTILAPFKEGMTGASQELPISYQ